MSCFFLLIYFLLQISSGQKVALNGIYGDYNGIEYIYQLPPIPRDQIEGVVFIAHGCNRRGTDWWPKSASCEKCIGMPICQSILASALQHHFIALASSSSPAERLCWSSNDYPRLLSLLRHFYHDIIRDFTYQTPLHLMGWSNGGYFLGGFVQNTSETLPPIKVASLVVAINTIKLLPVYSANHLFPIPTLFVAMKKDGGILHHIHSVLPLLKNTTLVLAHERPVTKSFLYEHGMGTVSREESELVHSLLKKHGFLDNSTNLLRQDPRSYNHWRQVLWKEAPELSKRDSLIHDHSPIWEMLNSAYAYHEMTDERNEEMFEFMHTAILNNIHAS